MASSTCYLHPGATTAPASLCTLASRGTGSLSRGGQRAHKSYRTTRPGAADGRCRGYFTPVKTVTHPRTHRRLRWGNHFYNRRHKDRTHVYRVHDWREIFSRNFRTSFSSIAGHNGRLSSQENHRRKISDIACIATMSDGDLS